MILIPPGNTIIQDFQNGDSRALSQVYHFYYRTLCYFADKIIDDKQAAEDIAAETFIKLWERHADFDSVQNIRSFLFITARNACLNFLKHAKIEIRYQKELKLLSDENNDYIINEQIEAEVLRVIYEEVENLPEQCRNIFKLLFYRGMTTAEIAGHLSLSVQTVRNQKTKAIRMLKLTLLKRDLPLGVVLLFLSLISQDGLN